MRLLLGGAPRVGEEGGITEEEIRAMETEQYQDFSEPERAAIQYARDLTAEASGDASGEALYKNFNDEQVVEITLVAAMANFTNRFNNGLGVQPEQ